MTLSRNTDRVVQCKLELVKAFSEAKQAIKENTPAQAQELERKKVELELTKAKQKLQETGQAILAS
jgi:phage regulator Rha-like protein